MSGVSLLYLKDDAGTTIHEFQATDQWFSHAEAGAITGNTPLRKDTFTSRGGGRSPRWAGKEQSERSIQVHYEMLATTITQHDSDLADLKGAYDMRHDWLWLYFSQDGYTKRVRCIPQQLRPDRSMSTHKYDGTLVLEGGVYENSTEEGPDTPTTMTTSPDTHEVTNNGNIASQSVTVLLQPTVQKASSAGQRYKFDCTPINRTSRAWASVPFDICDYNPDALNSPGWNHGAQVTAGHSRSDGQDVEVYVNKVRVPRWPGGHSSQGWNNNATAIWINLDMPPGRYWRLAKAISSGATTTFYVKERLRLASLPPLPFVICVPGSTGLVSELCTVTAVNEEAGSFTVTRQTRNSYNISTIAIDTKLWWAPVHIEVVYGWTTNTPDLNYIDDDEKPRPAASTSAASGNGRWYIDSMADPYTTGDTQRLKPRQPLFRPIADAKFDREKKTGQGDMYWRWIPYISSGSIGIKYRANGPVDGAPLTNKWLMEVPIGIDDFTFDQVTTNLSESAPNEGKLVVSYIDQDGTLVYGDEFESSSTTGENIATTLGGYGIVFELQPHDVKLDPYGSTPHEPVDDDSFLISNLSIDFLTAEAPLAVLSQSTGFSESNIYQFGRPEAPATIENEIGQEVSIYGLVVTLSSEVTISTNTSQRLIDATTAVGHIIRGDLLLLPAGTTDLTYTETGIGTVKLGLDSYRSEWN